ncbi:YbaB/EbfC family nucleoid-associated protein [Nocardia sp. CA-107356]|uniref:YbaB/EbfC family nucleoid-associated protein n=1 Tax=Nocardia sp. CA-107356 TaxID=3239972 RepID=UPI003D94725C
MVDSMEELEAQARRQLNRMLDLGDQMASIIGRETSEDGSITAEVDANGALRGLEFTTAVTRLSPAQFEQALISTAAAAAQAAFTRRGELVAAFNDDMA